MDRAARINASGSWGRPPRGFTLIELMIVVVIVGILSVLAIYGVRKYVAHSKTTEARNSMGQIAKDAYTAYQRESMSGAVLPFATGAGASNQLCLSASGSVPSTLTKIGGHKYQTTASEWNVDEGSLNKGFACLRFTMDHPQYYAYSYSADAAGTSWFTGMANGDLNGDGTYSTFSLAGSVVAGGVLTVAPNIVESQPTQ